MTEPGVKHDNGKSPLFRGAIGYFPLALSAVADVSAYGASKYAWDGWRSVPCALHRYQDALARHLALMSRETSDPESRLPHAAHVAWNALAVLELTLHEQNKP